MRPSEEIVTLSKPFYYVYEIMKKIAQDMILV